MNNNGLIICPQCLEKQKRNILGSVAPDGKFYVLRSYGHGMTIIEAKELMVTCTCGFGTMVIKPASLVTYTIKV